MLNPSFFFSYEIYNNSRKLWKGGAVGLQNSMKATTVEKRYFSCFHSSFRFYLFLCWVWNRCLFHMNTVIFIATIYLKRTLTFSWRVFFSPLRKVVLLLCWNCLFMFIYLYFFLICTCRRDRVSFPYVSLCSLPLSSSRAILRFINNLRILSCGPWIALLPNCWYNSMFILHHLKVCFSSCLFHSMTTWNGFQPGSVYRKLSKNIWQVISVCKVPFQDATTT